MTEPVAASVYTRQLAGRKHGCALFEPDPGDGLAVEIGDVGYVEKGGWARLFNCSKAHGDSDNKLGVPNGYQPFEVGEIQRRGPLQANRPIYSESMSHREAQANISAGPLVQAGVEFSFEILKEEGAVLLLEDDADRRDAFDKGRFAQTIRKHHAAWLEFANGRLGRSIHLNDLVLVTGCDKTSAWACASFWGNSSRAVAGVNVGQGGLVQGGLSISWKSSNHACAEGHAGRSSLGDGRTITAEMRNDADASQSLPRNQCVFVRGYKMLDRKTYRLRYPEDRDLKQRDDGFVHLPHKRGKKHPGPGPHTPGPGPNNPGPGPNNPGPGPNNPGPGPDSPGPGPSAQQDPSPGPSRSSRRSGQSPQDEDGGKWNGGASDSDSRGQSEEQPSSSGSSEMESMEYDSSDCELGEDLHLYMQSNPHDALAPLNILLEYILENSTAELALVHDDDLISFGQDVDLVNHFEERIHEIAPRIFIDDLQIGMLETTYRASRSLLTDRPVVGSKAVDKPVSTQNNTVQLTPDGHPDNHDRLNSLGLSLLRRYQHLGSVVDLDKAISTLDAVRLTRDGHPDRPRSLSNLGLSLLSRFERLGVVADLEKAISVQGDAVRLTPDGHPHKPGHLNNLGNSFKTRSRRLGDVADIDKAISALDDALQLSPDGHLNKLLILNNLANSFQIRFQRLGDAADRDKAILHISSVAHSSASPAGRQFQAALTWAKWALQSGHPSCLEAYRRALDLLPHVAWHGLPLAERHRNIANIGDVVRDAAAAAIASERYGTAVEWLEEGRTITWDQLLHLRVPVDDLRAAESGLADRLAQVSAELERLSTRGVANPLSHELSTKQPEVDQDRRRLASEWDTLVERARAIPGFEDFLRPKKLSQLRNAARAGPVVLINMHERRCDALVLQADRDEVIHIPLEHFSCDQALSMQDALDGSISTAGIRDEPASGDGGDTTFGTILSELWSCIVKPVLDILAIPISTTGDPPRIWWCATGPLAFLPLHAAGIYESDEPGSKIGDYVTSSYTPSLTALLEMPHSTKLDEFRLLAITQPPTPGQSPLPSAKEGLIGIRQHAGNLPVMSLEGVEATMKRVVQGIKKCGWFHFTGHGTQDTVNPMESALLLEDGRLTLSDIIDLLLPHAEFAFLSASETAKGDKRLPEEAVHLAAGMLLAGYRSVIATTWSIEDKDASVITDVVYARLLKDQRPDFTRAAHALHHAVKRLREEGAPLTSWAPFIHIGM